MAAAPTISKGREEKRDNLSNPHARLNACSYGVGRIHVSLLKMTDTIKVDVCEDCKEKDDQIQELDEQIEDLQDENGNLKDVIDDIYQAPVKSVAELILRHNRSKVCLTVKAKEQS